MRGMRGKNTSFINITNMIVNNVCVDIFGMSIKKKGCGPARLSIFTPKCKKCAKRVCSGHNL